VIQPRTTAHETVRVKWHDQAGAIGFGREIKGDAFYTEPGYREL
jgi:hypothetical protein